MQASEIRPYRPADLPAVKTVIDAAELFPSALLDDMVPATETASPDADGAFWLVHDDGAPTAVAYCAPEPMANGTWNLLLIAVHPDHQGRGIGTALTRHVEDLLTARGARVLLVETSGTDDFARTRGFYRYLGYAEEARIREYYDARDDKIVFHKAL